MNFTFSQWDVALVAMITAQAGLLAYLHHPRWKMLLLSLPFPFTLATLSLGSPIDVTHMAALLVLLAYAHGVRVLHQSLCVPILVSIILAASGYCLLSSVLVAVLPEPAHHSGWLPRWCCWWHWPVIS